MKQRIICKTLAVAVIILFIGLAIQPGIAVQPEIEIDVEPKDYLFQTIIEIANNPEVKDLLEQYDNDLFKVDIDRSVYLKILVRNPRLFCSMIFIRPSLTFEYLDNNLKNGQEITSILDENKVQGFIESLEVRDNEIFNDLNNIIINDGGLLERLETLKEMNKRVNPITLDGYDICFVIEITFLVSLFLGLIFFSPLSVYYAIFEHIELPILQSIIFLILTPFSCITMIFVLICVVTFIIGYNLECPLFMDFPW